MPHNLKKQIEFILVSDRLKHVERLNLLSDGSRNENTAEHSWHTTLQTIILSSHAPHDVNIDRVIKLLIMHDLVEIHAGDNWVTSENIAGVTADENAAATRLFGDLPQDQGDDFMALWEEFSAKATNEARFAHAMDALHPMILVWGPGSSNKAHADLSAADMKARKRKFLAEFPALWAFAVEMLDDAVARGELRP